MQNLMLVSHLKTIQDLKKKNCSIQANMAQTPYKLDHLGFQRNQNETTVQRSKTWNQIYLKKDHLIKIDYRFQNSITRPIIITSTLIK
jgi:hypothetical protein